MRTLAYPKHALALALVAGLLGLQAQAQSYNSNKSVPAAQAPLTAQERLDAIRQGLVEASLQTPTRVSTTTWLDPQGSLRENSRFQNNLDVRGVKVAAFERDLSGQAKARLQFPADANANTNAATGNKSGANAANEPITETGFLGAVQKFNRLLTKTASYAKELMPQEAITPSCTPKLSEHMNHVMDFGMVIDPASNQVALQSLLPLLQSEWVDNSDSTGNARAWRAVKGLPAPSMSKTMTSYERALVGNRPASLPWQATLKIRTNALPATGVEGMLGYAGNNLVLNLDFQLINTEGQAEKFEESTTLQIEVERPAWSAPRLSTASMSLVQEQLQAWRGAAEQWLSCQAMNPTVTAVQAQQLQINAGALAGVRAGDEWLVANPAKFPAELLSKDGAPQTVLAKVQTVTPYNAQLVVVAGPAQAVQADWRAWPTDTLGKEPSNTQRTTASAKRSVKTAANAAAAHTVSSY
jgi:hypothetical protein